MSKLIRFVNHSFKHFLIHGVEDFCDGSNQFKDDYPYSFADDYFEADKGSLLVNKVGKKRRTIPARFIHHTSQPFEHRLEHLRSGM